MKLVLRVVLASSLLAGMIVATEASTFAADTIVVSCSNGFTRTVAARAAHGVATSLTKFNAYTHSGVTCAAAPGAPRAKPALTWVTLSCSNGFTRRLPSHASPGITRALNKFNANSHSGVTCSLV